MTEAEKHPSARRRHGQAGPTEKMREYLEVIYYLSARQEPVIGARLVASALAAGRGWRAFWRRRCERVCGGIGFLQN